MRPVYGVCGSAQRVRGVLVRVLLCASRANPGRGGVCPALTNPGSLPAEPLGVSSGRESGEPFG
ncbi:MAG: hypothetical protein LBP74_07555, partial [Treponema sp.]|nr:hypothetical protein [Treponema sp.]